MTIIEDLEQQVEHWRQRAEVAEAALGISDAWLEAVSPLTLAQTRIMRLLAVRPCTGIVLMGVLARDYPAITPDLLKVHFAKIRGRMPEAIAPTRLQNHFAAYDVPDRSALREWLETGQLPDRRAA
jgi:hypothetical protein